jgi:5-oxoprolinase (ATP-hydrolysing)
MYQKRFLLTLISGMEYAVQYQHEQYEGNLKPGDHILPNHPLASGTHLPDITIITPLWDHAGKVLYSTLPREVIMLRT